MIGIGARGFDVRNQCRIARVSGEQQSVAALPRILARKHCAQLRRLGDEASALSAAARLMSVHERALRW